MLGRHCRLASFLPMSGLATPVKILDRASHFAAKLRDLIWLKEDFFDERSACRKPPSLKAA